jgi:hypothetical protein
MTERLRPRIPLSLDRLLGAAPELAVLAVVGVWAIHAFQVLRHAVDVPFYDDWAFVPPAEGRLRWLPGLEVDHRVVPTKLLILALHSAGGWDLALHQRIGWALFSLAQLALGVFLVRSLAGGPGASLDARRAAVLVAAGFVLFQLSALPRANHVWAVQSAVHFLLLFTLLAAIGLFDPAGRLRWQIPGAIAAVVVQLTQAAGIVIALALAAGFLWTRAHPAATTGRRSWRRDVALLAPVALTAIWAIAAHGRDRVVDYPQADLLGASFWRFLLDLVALGFGFGERAPAIGLALLLATLAPAAVLAARCRLRPGSADAGLLALVAALLATLALIAWARADLDPAASKASRFAEIATLLLPLGAALWYRAAGGRPVLRRAVLSGLWLLAAAAFADDWRFGDYRHIAELRLEGGECAAAAWRDVGPADCPTVLLPHQPAGALLARARDRGIRAARATALPPAPAPIAEPGSAAGVIDHATSEPPWLVVRGWAVDREAGGPAVELVLISRGRRVPARLTRLPRPDVARAEGLDEAALVGFELRARRSVAPALLLDGIAVEALDAAGRRSRLLAPARATSAPAGRPGARGAPTLPILELADGRRPHPLPGALEGRAIVDARPGGEVSVSGWAVDPVLLEPADRILVLDGERRVLADLAPSLARAAVAARYGSAAVRRSGFRTAPLATTGGLRVLAISRRGAFSEIPVTDDRGEAAR